MSTLKKVHFPNLNELRFLCASLVILHHVEQVRANAGIFNLHHIDLFKNGGLAVNVFFVLSGFLITYLLLVDIVLENKVDIKKFYINRTLRIWPLYFILVFIGFVALPLILHHPKFASKFPYLSAEGILLYIFFLPNLANGIWTKHFLIPLWSIGVEEQFYLIFAPLISWFRNHVLKLLFAVFILRFFIQVFIKDAISNESLQYFINSMSFESMAIGGFFAWIYVFKHPLEKLFTAKIFQVLCVGYVLYAIFYHSPQSLENSILFKSIGFVKQSIFSLACGGFIYNIATNQYSLFRLKNRLLDSLGTISYGIYMYHMIFVFAAITLIEKFTFLQESLVSSLFVYFFVFGFTILTSFLSFRFIEKKILSFK